MLYQLFSELDILNNQGVCYLVSTDSLKKGINFICCIKVFAGLGTRSLAQGLGKLNLTVKLKPKNKCQKYDH